MDNKVKLKLMSETIINVSETQIGFLIDKFQKISYLESKLENSNLRFSPNALVTSLLERESVDSSILEGTQTQYDEMYYDISEGIRDRYSWEVRNLINLYKFSYKELDDKTLDYTVDDLKFLHRKLYSRELKDYKSIFDPINIIKNIKPGHIIVDDSKANWIGFKSNHFKEITLLPIKPSKKIMYLEDMFKMIRKSRNTKNIKILIMFHPYFEAVHPFADGNGRIGRVLLVNLFKYLGFSKFNWIFISEYWKDNKDEYIKQIKKVQTTNNWNDWIYFFVGSLSITVDRTYRKLNSILNIYLDITSKNSLTEIENKILKYFFMYPKLNKQKTILHLKNQYNTPNTTAYRSFDKIVKLISAEKGTNYTFQSIWKIINQ